MLTYASGGGAGGAGAGDVVGPASSTDNAIARYDSTTGKLLQDSAVTVSDVAAAVVTVATVPGASPGRALVIDVPEPAATTGASVAGKTLTLRASDAVASTDTAGAAAGGAVNITAGAAARNTSGNAAGGFVVLTPGAGIGTGRSGAVAFTAATAGFTSLKDDGFGQLIVRNGDDSANATFQAGRLASTGTGTTKLIDIAGGSNVLGLGSGISLAWANAANGDATKDVGAIRDGVGLLRVSNGSTGLGVLNTGVSILPKAASPVTVAVVESRGVYTNEGAGGSITFNLPTAVAGYDYSFVVQATQNMVVTASAGDTIRIAAGVSSAGGTATNGTIGSTLRIVSINATEWIALGAPNGTWTLA